MEDSRIDPYPGLGFNPEIDLPFFDAKWNL